MTQEVLTLLQGEPQTIDQPVGADIIRPQTADPVGATLAVAREPSPSCHSEERSDVAIRPPDYRAHLASLLEQERELQAEFPGFSLAEALGDKDFVRMTSPAMGLSVRRAFEALHGEELRQAAARRSLETVARSLAGSAARPREGGRGLTAGALTAVDYRHLSQEQRADIRRRVYDAAARGEKLYP